MTDLESFRAELVEFLERELPRQLGELPPPSADYWGGRRPELPHPSSKRYCDLMARARPDRADLAQGVRRRRARQGAGRGSSPPSCGGCACRCR